MTFKLIECVTFLLSTAPFSPGLPDQKSWETAQFLRDFCRQLSQDQGSVNPGNKSGFFPLSSAKKLSVLTALQIKYKFNVAKIKKPRGSAGEKSKQ